MEKKCCFKSKLLLMLIGVCALLILGCKNVNAASASISASNKSVKIGDKVSINVSVDAMAWNVKVNGSGVSGSIVGGNMESMTNKSTTKSYTLDTSKAGSYTVSISGDVTDANGNNSNVSDSVTVKVSEKSNNNSDNNNTNTAKNDNTTKKNTTEGNTVKEPSFQSTNETVYATGDINVRKSYSADSDKIGSLEDGESITRVGIGDNGWSKVTYNGSTGYIKTSLLSTEEPEKSSDKALKTLLVTPGVLDPEFNPEVTNYTLNVNNDVEKLDIKAAPNDEKAKVEISGNENLQSGDNMVKIIVTAQDETVRTYTINVKKGKSVVLGLTTLSINGYNLSPKFEPNKYEYKLNITDYSVKKLDITATASDENAKVEILGNTDLKDGNNTIQITVTSQDGTEKVIYQIIANKTPMGAGTTKNSDNGNIVYIGIIIAIIAIFLVAVIIIKKRKNAKYIDNAEDDYEDYEDLYGYSTKKANISTDEDIINSNNVVDHELFGELPEEKYSNSKSNVYSGTEKNGNEYAQTELASSIIKNNSYSKVETQSPYKDVYKTINSSQSDIGLFENTKSIYENGQKNETYSNLYGSGMESTYNNVNLNSAYSDLHGSYKSEEPIYNNAKVINEPTTQNYNDYNSYKESGNENLYSSYKKQQNFNSYSNLENNNLYDNIYGNNETNNYTTSNTSSYNSDLYKSNDSNYNVNENLFSENLSKNNDEKSRYSFSSYNNDNTQYQENSLSITDDIDDDEYTLDDNYKMRRTKGKHSK